MQTTPPGRFSRRGFMGGSLLLGVPGIRPAIAAAAKDGPIFTLQPRPLRLFKTADASHEKTESWVFSLIVQSRSMGPLTPAAMKVILLKGNTVVRITRYSTEGFAALTYHSGFPPTLADGTGSPTPIYWPFVIRLRNTEPVAMGVDAMRIYVEAKDAAGRTGAASITIPVETYKQKTALIFPFKGKGIILQGGVTNGGHRNRSGEFALDAMGLDDAWSVQAPGDGKKNTDYPGWGRSLLAPAGGTVVHARNDRPDQPVGDESNVDFFADEYKKYGGGDPGNHLVIDHGNGEFSGIAHFMAGSMLVKQNDRLIQGQVLGKLGHSGDTDTPHVHYQLQAGPDFTNSDGLPCKFTNVNQQSLDRGTYFEASWV